MKPNTAQSTNVNSPVSVPPQNPAPAAAEPALSSMPDSWPGAFGLYKYSKQAVKLNLGTIALLWLLNIAVGGGFDWILKRSGGGLLGLVVGSLVTAAMTLTYLAGIRGKRLEIGDALSQALPIWLKMIGLTLLVGISVVISLLLLIIPFFFVLPRLVLAYYFLVDKKLGVIDAYKASWHTTKGNVGKVWGIIGASILMALLMITIIGIPFSIYFLIMYSAATAILYEFLNKTTPATPPSSAPATTPPASPPAPVVQ